MDGAVLLETVTAAWPYAEHDAKVFQGLGIVEVLDTPKGPALSIMDSRIVTIWQLMRAEGYTEENGFPPTVVDFYAKPADMVAREESQRFIDATEGRKIGRAPCGERGCQDGEILVVARTFKQKTHPQHK